MLTHIKKRNLISSIHKPVQTKPAIVARILLEVYWNVIDFSKLKNKSEGGQTYTQMKIFEGYINYHVTKSEVLQVFNKSHSINHFNY